ncbi:hypothetical protein DOTSEDRAFT_29042 [Dothistroma septosporum NZE10]|uniref:Uncharacterized protein n=1 Tax=Dothistroma septosporum (strain NZE10 / CBS 128990) TaxID=675120 RepID=M2XHD2_DOTSN|nr:hypothetical protein DOTSEDRAFT_29042 [Dothistroma septosporum NZE10]
MLDPPADAFTFTADNTISQCGINVDKLDQVAAEVQTQLKTGFGDCCEKSSRGLIRHLQMPSFFTLLEEVHALNTVLTRLHAANERDRTTMQERVLQVLAKSYGLQEGLKSVAADAKEACKQTAALQGEIETLRKDIIRLEKKAKELERIGRTATIQHNDHAAMDKLRRDMENPMKKHTQRWSDYAAYRSDHHNIIATNQVLIRNWPSYTRRATSPRLSGTT